MGTVYRCSHVEAPRLQAAVKVLGDGLHRPSEAQVRFIREAEILGALDHPHIVRVRGLRMDVHPPFIEMDFVDGDPLDRVVKNGAVPVERALPWMTQLASALSYLHARGVRHRDVKPGNVLINDEDRVVLVDFGLATDADLERITQEGLSFGTVSYAPPEWMDPDRLDAVQWDLYAVGVIFYELLTGSIAFPLSGKGPVRKQLLQVAMAKQKAPPLDPGEGIPEAVRALIRKATTKDIESRFATADELLAALKAAARAGNRSVVSSARVRNGVVVVGGVVAASALLAVGTVFVLNRAVNVAPPPEEPAGRELDLEVAPPQVGQLKVRGPVGTHVRVAGMAGVIQDDGEMVLEDVPGGEQQVRFAIGEACEPCLDGAECSTTCGVGDLSIDVASGGGVQLDLPPIPRVPVSVVAPQLAKGRGGVFKKKDWPLRVTLGARTLQVKGPGEASGSAAPGVHTLVVDVGTCAAEERGCLPDGCPPKCSSLRRSVTVPWSGRVQLSLDSLPPPQR